MRRSLGQFWRFGLAGIAGLGLDVAVLTLLMELGSGFYLGRALSFLAAVWLTWQFNKRFAFKTEGAFLPYLLAMLGGGAINYGASCVVVWWGFLPAVAVCAGSLAGMLVNFASAKWLVFKA